MFEEMELPAYVFVYGTLKAGYGNHRCLGESEFICNAVSDSDTYKMVNVGFPYLFDEGNARVKGEIYRVTSPYVASALDALEGYPRHYTRARRVFYNADDPAQEYMAWVYLNPDPSRYSSYRQPILPNEQNLLIWGR